MRVIVIGCGIGGAAAALSLIRHGCDVRVYERAPGAREVGAGVSIWGNAIRALRHIGAHAPVVAAGEPMRVGELRTSAGRVLSKMETWRLDEPLGLPSVLVHRADLLDALVSQLPPGVARFGKPFESYEERGDRVVARFADGSEDEADLLVGADGLRSAVRRNLRGEEEPRYAGYTCWRGLCEFPLERWERGRVCEVWGRGARFGITRLGPGPAGRGRVYWFGCVNAPRGTYVEDAIGRLRSVFGRWCDPVPDLVAATARSAIIQDDILDRPPARFTPGRPQWRSPGGRVVLLGDAAHATTPNMGQGACMAIESGVLLGRLLALRERVEALDEYERRRMRRTSPVIRTSWAVGRMGQWSNPAACAVRNLGVVIGSKLTAVREHRRTVGFDVLAGVGQPDTRGEQSPSPSGPPGRVRSVRALGATG